MPNCVPCLRRVTGKILRVPRWPLDKQGGAAARGDEDVCVIGRTGKAVLNIRALWMEALFFTVVGPMAILKLGPKLLRLRFPQGHQDPVRIWGKQSLLIDLTSASISLLPCPYHPIRPSVRLDSNPQHKLRLDDQEDL